MVGFEVPSASPTDSEGSPRTISGTAAPASKVSPPLAQVFRVPSTSPTSRRRAEARRDPLGRRTGNRPVFNTLKPYVRGSVRSSLVQRAGQRPAPRDEDQDEDDGIWPATDSDERDDESSMETEDDGIWPATDSDEQDDESSIEVEDDGIWPATDPDEQDNESSMDSGWPNTDADEVDSFSTASSLEDNLDHENLTFRPVSGRALTLAMLIDERRHGPGLPTSTSHQNLPESLVWYTLIALLRATYILHSGPGGVFGGYEWPARMPIVHNAISPEDILYVSSEDAVDGYDFPRHGHRTCKLGNFGKCIILPSTAEPEDDYEEDVRRQAFADVHRAGEESGCEAPELIGNGQDMIPGLESDLWSIGAVCVAMMTGRHVWDFILEIDFSKRARRNSPRGGKLSETWQSISLRDRHALLLSYSGTADITAALPDGYDVLLRVLVESLLTFDPLDRGQASEVLEDVEAGFERRAAAGGMSEFEEPSEAEKTAMAVRRFRAATRRAEEWLERREREDPRGT